MIEMALARTLTWAFAVLLCLLHIFADLNHRDSNRDGKVSDVELGVLTTGLWVYGCLCFAAGWEITNFVEWDDGGFWRSAYTGFCVTQYLAYQLFRAWAFGLIERNRRWRND